MDSRPTNRASLLPTWDRRKATRASPGYLAASASTVEQLGKLEVSPIVFRDQSIAAGAVLLPVLDTHVIETAQLPLLHQDPFDRLLIAQVRVEGLMAVSSDGQWSGYDVSLHRL